MSSKFAHFSVSAWIVLSSIQNQVSLKMSEGLNDGLSDDLLGEKAYLLIVPTALLLA